MMRYLVLPKGRSQGPYDLFAAARPVWQFVKNVAQRMENRRAVAQLLEWDEPALRDIGLTRADVRLALGLPLSDDPSMQLMRWAGERRAAKLQPRGSRAEVIASPQLCLLADADRSSNASSSRR